MEKKKTSNYTIVLNILGEEWKSSGRTIEEAMEKMKISWEQISGKGTITVTKGRAKYVHLAPGKVIRRVFANKIARASMAKNLLLLLGTGIKTNIPEKIIEE